MTEPIKDAAAEADADGFVVESHSAPIEESPADTTLEAKVETPAPVAKVVADEGDGDAVSASAAIADAAKGAKPEAGKAKKGSLEQRRQSLTKEIDTLTYKKHETDREYQAGQARLAKLQGELAALEGKLKPAAAEPVKPVALTRPVLPKYRDFATDEEYEAAVAKHQTDDEAWLLKRDEERDKALETRVVESVEQRLNRERNEAAAGEADRALVDRLNVARAAHPDWQAKSEAVADLKSAWWDPVRHAGISPTPFLSDLAMNVEEGPEILYRLGTLMETEPDRAQRLADLLPTKQLREAIIISPSPLALLEYFSTDEGEQVFGQLKGMHPSWLGQAIGALSARLEAAPGGPVSGVLHPITKASPSAKPPVGAPRTREQTTGSGAPPGNFDKWMAEEDAKDAAKRAKELGIAATA